MIDKQSSEYMCDVNMTFINSSQLIYICVIVKRTRSFMKKKIKISLVCNLEINDLQKANIYKADGH